MSASMEIFAWPLAVVLIVLVALFGFRKSVSKILEGIKLRKVPGAEFEQVPQPQIEEAKTDSKLSPANPVQEQSEINDPVLGPKIHALHEELENLSKDAGQREKLLIRAIAVWQVNHENERVARYIFGSQLEILLLLNARPSGETLEKVRAIYDRAVQNFPAIYTSYSFEPYLGYLERAQFVTREGDRLTVTPRGKAFLHYLVAIGDTLPRQG